jgi:hypothetical protein
MTLFNTKKGETVGFFCPICHQNLVSEFNANLAKVIMIEENDSECEVLFSKVVGEQATYKIKNGIIEAFGADKNKYLDSLKKNKK